DVKMAAPRPKDVSLDSSKAFALGYNPLSVREELEILKSWE
ncbi:MAG: NAD(P)-dependent oxidoreductase, partial [Dolichospermum sp.]